MVSETPVGPRRPHLPIAEHTARRYVLSTLPFGHMLRLALVLALAIAHLTVPATVVASSDSAGREAQVQPPPPAPLPVADRTADLQLDPSGQPVASAFWRTDLRPRRPDVATRPCSPTTAAAHRAVPLLSLAPKRPPPRS